MYYIVALKFFGSFKMSFKVAVIQDSPVVFNLAATIDKVETLTNKAISNGAELVLFPEAFISAYPKGLDFGARVGQRSDKGREDFRRYYDSSLDFKSKEYYRLLGIAKKYKVLLVIGVIERDGGTLYCTVLFISKKGELLEKHRKIMPTAMERLIWGFGDGSTMPVIDTELGKLGSVICWENYMPMMRMGMYSKGIELYCAPTADDRETWISTVQHIALEGRCFVFSACQYLERKDCPKDYAIDDSKKNPKSVIMNGGSCVISPLGKIIAGPIRNKAEIIFADIDLNEIIKGKYDFDAVGHYARPDIFELNINERSNNPVTPQKIRKNIDKK